MTTTLPTPTALDLPALNQRFATAAPQEIVAWAAETFGPQLIMTSSFGAESMCTIHLAHTAMPGIKIVAINTGYLFPETLAFMEEMRSRFNLNVLEFHTRNDPIIWLSVNGEPDPRTRNNVKACCGANKDPVMDRAMKQLAPAAFFRGVRADQTKERAAMQPVMWFKRANAYAISPILKWTAKDIHAYMKQHDLPYHPLWEKGYTSIGCNPITCTAPVWTGDADPSERSGRWAGLDKKECGINLDEGAGI